MIGIFKLSPLLKNLNVISSPSLLAYTVNIYRQSSPYEVALQTPLTSPDPSIATKTWPLPCALSPLDSILAITDIEY